MIFIDSNVPMYIIGADHPNRARARTAVEQLSVDRVRLVTDAEVFQEILHRYDALERLDAVQPAFDVLLDTVDVVEPITLDDVQHAKGIVFERPQLSARDALHVAVMSRIGVRQILSFDRGFDAVPGIERVT